MTKLAQLRAQERARQSRLRAKAQSRAYARLSRLYPDDWRRLYAEERARLAEEQGPLSTRA